MLSLIITQACRKSSPNGGREKVGGIQVRLGSCSEKPPSSCAYPVPFALFSRFLSPTSHDLGPVRYAPCYGARVSVLPWLLPTRRSRLPRGAIARLRPLAPRSRCGAAVAAGAPG